MISHALMSDNSPYVARDKCFKDSQENTELGPSHYSRCFYLPSLNLRQLRGTARNCSTPTVPNATAPTDPGTRSWERQSGPRIWVPPKPRSSPTPKSILKLNRARAICHLSG